MLVSLIGTFEDPAVEVFVGDTIRWTQIEGATYDGPIFEVVAYDAVENFPLTARLYEGDLLLDEFTARGDCIPNVTTTTIAATTTTMVEEELPQTGAETAPLVVAGLVLVALGSLSVFSVRRTGSGHEGQ